MTTTLFGTTRRTAALLAPLAALPLALGTLVPAEAAQAGRARITAAASDSTPASGQTFRVSGRLTRGGEAVAGRTVKVQTLRDGSWSNLTGARMSTSDSGRYDLGVVLSQTGQRTLRVVGVVPGHNAFKRFGVTVH